MAFRLPADHPIFRYECPDKEFGRREPDAVPTPVAAPDWVRELLEANADYIVKYAWHERAFKLGQLRFARRTLFRMLMDKFGTVPSELAERIQATHDLTRLDDALHQLLRIDRLEDLTL